MQPSFRRWPGGPLAVLLVVQTGCSTLLADPKTPPPASATHCEGSEVNTSVHIAVVPIPVVAFFTPRFTTNAPDSGRFLGKCGGTQQSGRKVEVNYAPCVPTIFLTTLITLGIAGVCPTVVSWEANVIP